MCDLNKFQDDIGQLARLKTYTHLLLCFPLPEGESQESIIDSLHAAANDLVGAFPWLAAKVVHEGRRPGSSGHFKLAPCPEFAAPNSLVVVKDCSDLLPCYDDIIEAQGPCTMLDGSALGPVVAFPDSYEESESSPARVFALQANFINGGLLLDAAAQHNFMDGGALFHCMTLFARAMRGEPFTDLELEQGNRDRRSIIPLLRADEPMLDHSHLKCTAATTSLTPRPSRAPASWRFFRVPAHKATELKSQANRDLRREASKTPFCSSNDALSAFLWQRLAAVRLQRTQQPEELTKFSRAMDARRAMGVPKEYMGQMGYNATTRVSFGELASMSLGATTAVMRSKVQEVNTEYSVRSWATFISKEADKSTIMFGGSFNPDTDIGVSSLVHNDLSTECFGVLGAPELVRRPNFRPLEGVVYLWSKTAKGDVDILACLNEVDTQALMADEEWSTSTVYIG